MKSLNIKSSAIFLFIMIVFCYQSWGQFTLTGELRPRSEFRNGFKQTREKETDPAFFVEQRTRLYLNYQSEKFLFHIAAQDVRIWGNTNQVYKSDPALTNLYEAYGIYYFNDKFYTKVGRQAIDHDYARFMGDLDWAQQGRSHDALLLGYQNDEIMMQLQVGAAFNQDVPFEPAQLSGTEYFGLNNYKTMQYAWFHNQHDKGQYSVTFHNNGEQTADTTVAFRQTYGIFTETRFDNIDLGAEFYFQGGKNNQRQSVRAFLLALNATYQTSLTPLTLGFDFLSGTEYGETAMDKSFIPLYGTNHKFYGFMDYFYVGNGHGQAPTPGGLLDIYFKTNFKTGEQCSLLANVHYFSSPVTVYDAENLNEKISSSLGVELDLVYVHQLGKFVKFWLGYSHMLPTESLVVIKRGVGEPSAMHNWAWAMIQFKPVLFSSAQK